MAALFFERVVFPAPENPRIRSPVPRELIHPITSKDVGGANFLPFALLRGGSIPNWDWEWPAFFIHKALVAKGTACVPVFTNNDYLKTLSLEGGSVALEF